MAEVTLEMVLGLVQKSLDGQNELRRTLNTTAAALRGEMAGIQSEMAGVQSEMAGVKTEMTGMRAEMATLRSEQREGRAQVRALVDDLEAALKAEIIGRITHFETQVEARLDALADRIGGGQA